MSNFSQLFVPLWYHNRQQSKITAGNQWLSLTFPPSSLLSGGVWRGRSPQPPSQAMTTKTIAPASNLRWLTTSEVCERLGVSYHTWSKWRQRGCGPRASKLPNGELRVREDWLHDFMLELEVRS